MIRKTLAILLTSVALTVGFTGCGDDKEENTNQPTQDPIADPENPTPDNPSVEPCKGDECSAKQQDAENKMASCDFAQAYEALNAVYTAQVKDNKIDAQTALDRSILGIIHILYREDVQAILPKLGFIAKSGLVDFKPLWQGDNGIFKQVFTGNHNYDGYGDLIPMTIAKDDDKAWEDTIDKALTFDNVLDVLVNLKPELESLASSLEEAAKLTGATALSPNAKIGCGLNNFKMDAADLNAVAAVLMIADAAIDLIAHYDFDFNIHDTIADAPEPHGSSELVSCRVTLSNDEVIEDECHSLDYKTLACDSEPGYDENTTELWCMSKDKGSASCIVNLDAKGNPTEDECKTKFSLDYKTLFCGKNSYDDENYLECIIPGDTDEEKKVEKYANMLLPHLLKATQSKRKVAGTDGVSAFKKAASLYLQALDGSAKGAFFDFSKIPAGALQDMKDIAKEMADGTGSLAKFIKPGLTVDLNKVFKDVLFAADNEFQKDPTANNDIETYGDDWFGDMFSGIYGDEVFLNEKLPNYILNTDLISHEVYYGEGIRSIALEFHANDKYDATFSSAWEDLNLGKWLNPHYYFAPQCIEGEECPELCSDETPYYFKDSNSADGYICTACWEKCEGKTPYCVSNIITGLAYCIDKPECPKGEQPYYGPSPIDDEFIYDATCVSMDGYESYHFCADDNGQAPNGRYVHYDKTKDAYTCSHCQDACTGDTPYCVNRYPGEDYYFAYFCAATESCPDGFEFAMNGQCLPKSGTPCPDELKTKDICLTQKTDEFSESALYYCNSYGEVNVIETYNSECKEVDVSKYGTDRKTIAVLVETMRPECAENDIYLDCVNTPDDKTALTGEVCVKTTDNTMVSINLMDRGIYLQVCTDNQYCGYSEELDMKACIDFEPEEP